MDPDEHELHTSAATAAALTLQHRRLQLPDAHCPSEMHSSPKLTNVPVVVVVVEVSVLVELVTVDVVLVTEVVVDVLEVVVTEVVVDTDVVVNVVVVENPPDTGL